MCTSEFNRKITKNILVCKKIFSKCKNFIKVTTKTNRGAQGAEASRPP